jgi:hypothetical protein
MSLTTAHSAAEVLLVRWAMTSTVARRWCRRSSSDGSPHGTKNRITARPASAFG